MKSKEEIAARWQAYELGVIQRNISAELDRGMKSGYLTKEQAVKEAMQAILEWDAAAPEAKEVPAPLFEPGEMVEYMGLGDPHKVVAVSEYHPYSYTCVAEEEGKPYLKRTSSVIENFLRPASE